MVKYIFLIISILCITSAYSYNKDTAIISYNNNDYLIHIDPIENVLEVRIGLKENISYISCDAGNTYEIVNNKLTIKRINKYRDKSFNELDLVMRNIEESLFCFEFNGVLFLYSDYNKQLEKILIIRNGTIINSIEDRYLSSQIKSQIITQYLLTEEWHKKRLHLSDVYVLEISNELPFNENTRKIERTRTDFEILDIYEELLIGQIVVDISLCLTTAST
jgi:hypothetical protein